MVSSAEGGFRLGPELQSLAEAGRINIAEMIRPLLSALAKETGETVDFAVYRQDHMVFVDQVIGTHRLRTVSAVGEALPLSNTANGKAALALLGDDTPPRLSPANSIKRRNHDGRCPTSFGRSNLCAPIRLPSISTSIPMVSRQSAWLSGNREISIPVPSHRFDGKRYRLRVALLKTLEQVTGAL